jgi:hypothetical protein
MPPLIRKYLACNRAFKIKTPFPKKMCKWLIWVWRLISEDIIINSVKKTKISETLYGTEDDYLGGREQR